MLEEALATAAVMLVVIRPRWLSATDKNGRKRLGLAIGKFAASASPPAKRRKRA